MSKTIEEQVKMVMNKCPMYVSERTDDVLEEMLTEALKERDRIAREEAVKEYEGKRPDSPTHWVSEPMTQKEAEIYVQGMYDLMMMVGCDGHRKHYDPLFFEGEVAHSYVLELDDGGRHHSYVTPQWVALKALLEFADHMRSEWDVGSNEYYKGNIETVIAQIEDNTPAKTKHYKR